MYGCKLFTELGQSRVDLRSDETLEFIDDLKRFQIDYHQANFNRFQLIGDDYQRPWRFVLSNLITGCLKVYAIEVPLWRDEILDCLEVW